MPAKNTFLKVRLDAAEMLDIERQAKLLNMPKSQLARLMLTGGAAAKPHQQPAPAAGGAFDDSRLIAIESRLSELEESSRASARAFDALLSQLNEFLRVPSFREYRARLVTDGVEKRQAEDDTQFLVRAASRYFVLYQQWPIPSDLRSFGPLPQSFDPSKFPNKPPA